MARGRNGGVPRRERALPHGDQRSILELTALEPPGGVRLPLPALSDVLGTIGDWPVHLSGRARGPVAPGRRGSFDSRPPWSPSRLAGALPEAVRSAEGLHAMLPARRRQLYVREGRPPAGRMRGLGGVEATADADVRTMRVWTHIHSKHSYDGHCSLEEIAAIASRHGIGAVLLSEHSDGWSDKGY